MSGFIFVAVDQRLYERFVEGMRFSGVWPSVPPLTIKQLALLSAEGGEIEAAALMTRGRKAATYTWHVVFDPVIPFDHPVDVEEVVANAATPTQAAVRAALESGGSQLSDSLFDDFLQAIIEARPDAAGPIERIRALIEGVPPLNARRAEGEPIVLYEGDAVALSLEIGGFDRSKQLESWSGTPRAPFLRGIEEFRVSEEQLIDHDARHFGDWKVIEDSLVSGVTFTARDGRRLTVLNVNHEPIEATLGVDLIYYNYDYASYVLVQYKRMQRLANDSEFRPNKQLETELARMRAIKLDDTEPRTTTDYRLDHRCCFMKLCWPTTRDFHAGEIVPGMYFPLVYWDLLVEAPVAKGKKGGVRLRGNTVGRRLNRTSFVRLVQDAWIGSRGVTTQVIEEAIRSGLQASRSLVLAVGTGQGPKSGSG